MKKAVFAAVFAALALILVSCLSAGPAGFRDDGPLVDPRLLEQRSTDIEASIQIHVESLPIGLGTAMMTTNPGQEISFTSADGSAFELLSFRSVSAVQTRDAKGKTLQELATYYRLLPDRIPRYSTRGSDGRFEFNTFLDSIRMSDLESAQTGDETPPDPSSFAKLRTLSTYTFVFRDSRGGTVPIQIMVENFQASSEL